MELDIRLGLDQFSQRLDDLKLFLEWQRLFDGEPTLSVGRFSDRDSNQRAIALAYDVCIRLALTLQTAFDQSMSSLSLKERRQLHSEFHRLLQECRQLAVPETFIKR